MSESLRALVVDDDPIARKTVKFALESEGFCCDLAVDGDHALRCLRDCTYDLVVTDLRMPNKHGYALSVELLEQNPRPLIVVHSSVDDPRLARDLMIRGVDDIVYKPTNYAAFAAKIKGLVNHRLSKDDESVEQFVTERQHPSEQEELSSEAAHDMANGVFVPISDIENKISLVSRILPISKTALDVFEMTRSECDATKLGAAIQRDASLAAEVLSIANSSFYNPSKNPITELDKAVVRIGVRRIGELALAAATLSRLTERKLPWLDMQTIWRQSIAAGLAVENLVDQGKHGAIDDSLALVAIMNTLGRVVLATLFPNHYRQLIKQCAERNEALIEREKLVFPENHARIMARLLSVWNIPDEICQPMNYILDSYASLSRLSDPARTKAELVKLGVFIAQLATRAWHAWDLVEIPPPFLLNRLQIHDITQIIEQTREDTRAIMEFKPDLSSLEKQDTLSQRKVESARTIFYENISKSPFDFIAQLIRAMGFDVVAVSPDCRTQVSKVLINCIGVSTDRSTLSLPSGTSVLVITDSDDPSDLAAQCVTLRTPVSYGVLRSSLVDVAIKGSNSKRQVLTTALNILV